MSRLATFWRGLRSMRPMLELRGYWWALGPQVHLDHPSPGDHWWAFHFHEMAFVIGPFWIGVRDTD